MARIDCYIDHTLCSGAKYSFCDDCKKAQEQKEYKEKTTKATTPAEVSLAHVPSKTVEFVSYDGAFPNLCSGTLVLKINGEKKEFPSGCLVSGGNTWFDENWVEHIEHGKWTVNVPKDLERFKQAIEDCVNENIPHGCCGGCE